MDNLRVASVRHRRRGQNRLWLPGADRGQKTMKPAPKLVWLEHAQHQIRFDQPGREEVLAAWFPRGRIVCVGEKVGPRSFYNHRFQLVVSDRARIIQREGQTKGGVGMYAGANRVGLTRQKFLVSLRQRLRERLQVLRPGAAVGLIHTVE